ncbi:MAG TPA: ABC transporter permease subunit [Gemmatimonadales bacterium]|nr:ABC transporter permease subunit [Gemmatimonadales bacterium]
MTVGTTPYRSGLRAGRDGFPQLLRAEWTKFRTVRGWVAGTWVAALVMVLLGLVAASGFHSSCGGDCSVPLGPDGEAVVDMFYFAHQPLVGDGSITVRVTSLTGLITYPPDHPNDIVPGVMPWAKAGVIIKESTKQGSAYAAVMVTGSHGARMQYNYIHDTAGSPGGVSAASPRWLRLTRSGDSLTGYESADGTHWTRIGTADLAGLPATAQVGLFVTSPFYMVVSPGVAGGFSSRLTQATAVFDQVSLQSEGTGGAWTGDNIGIGPGGPPLTQRGFEESGGRFTVSGTGDIAPRVDGGRRIEDALHGTFAGLIVVIVIGSMFITAEYRRGMIRTTLATSPRRGRVLAAKAIVIGSVTFVAGLAAAAVAVPLGDWILRANGNYLFPVTSLTELRVIAGTAALLAVVTVLALAVGAMLQRGAEAVTALIVMIVVPYVLAIAAPLPDTVSEWLLRLTPAAGFAIQQSLPRYPQINDVLLTPLRDFYPLEPWAGFAVLCAYTALALGLATFLLRRRDA